MRFIHLHNVLALVLGERKARVCLLILLPWCLTGCIPTGCGEECSPPSEAIAEMALLGATISSETRPFPETVDAEIVTTTLVTAKLKLYFAPHPDRLFAGDGTIGNFATYPYEYTYSTEVDGSFVEIPGTESFSNIYPPDSYHGAIASDVGPMVLKPEGNVVLVTQNIFYAPVRATHVELWIRDAPGGDRSLVRRIPLTSFHAWRKYIEPLIVGSS